MQDTTHSIQTFDVVRTSVGAFCCGSYATMVFVAPVDSPMASVSMKVIAGSLVLSNVVAVMNLDRRIKGKEGGLILPRYATPIAWITTVGLVVVLIYMAFEADFKW